MNKSVLSKWVGLVGYALMGMSSFAYAEPVKLVTGDDYGPFTDSQMQEGGLFTYLIKAIYAEMGVALDVKVQPWKRGYVETLRGDYHGTFPYIETEERRAIFHFSNPVLTSSSHLFIRKEDADRLKTVADFDDVATCLPVGYVFDYEMETLISSGKVSVIRPKDLSTCVQALRNGRVDFVNINLMTFAWTLKRLGGDFANYASLDDGRGPVHQYMIFPKMGADGEAMKIQFDQTVAAMKKSGKFKALLEAYAPNIGIPVQLLD